MIEDAEVPADAMQFHFVRARGHGGQHVNKASTAVQLRVRLGRTRLPEPVKVRLRQLAGSRLTHHDEIVIFADRHRSQLRNKEDALQRWAELLAGARAAPGRRIKTRPSRAHQKARLEHKRRRAERKQLRRKPRFD